MVDSTVRRAKRSYYSRSFLNSSTARSRRIIREALTGEQSRGGVAGLTVGGNKISDNFDMAEENLFIILPVLHRFLKDEIPQTNVSPYQYISDNHPGSLFLRPVTPEDCGVMIVNLKDSGYGIDAIPAMVLRKVRHLLSYPICLLINESFGMCRFPDSLKRASVTPIHKADSPFAGV